MYIFPGVKKTSDKLPGMIMFCFFLVVLLGKRWHRDFLFFPHIVKTIQVDWIWDHINTPRKFTTKHIETRIIKNDNTIIQESCSIVKSQSKHYREYILLVNQWSCQATKNLGMGSTLQFVPTVAPVSILANSFPHAIVISNGKIQWKHF